MSDQETRSAVEERGEFTLTLDGQAMVLRPSYEAIVAFEGTTGRGIMDLARDALSGKLTTGDLAEVVTACVRAWGRETGAMSASGAKPERIAQLILESDGGLMSVMSEVGTILALAVSGGLTAKGEAKAAKATIPTTD